jgi:hypothetical protein
MTTSISERIKVGVVFRDEGQKMEPKWFSWRGRHLKITKTTYMWREREGRNDIFGEYSILRATLLLC